MSASPAMQMSPAGDADGPAMASLPAKQRKSLGDAMAQLVDEMNGQGILYCEGVREFKRRFLLCVLRARKGNAFKAALDLGMHRNTLTRSIRELNLEEELQAIRNQR